VHTVQLTWVIVLTTAWTVLWKPPV